MMYSGPKKKSIINRRLKKDKISAYDIETFEKNQKIIPYCVVYILNEKFYYFYGNKCIIRSILSLLLQNNLIIYIHNLDFDGFLILEEISKYSKFKINISINNMKIYFLEISLGNKKIEFRCSQKILPMSLKKIAESFNLPTKLPFPYKFINASTLYYKGPTPNSSYFNSIKDYMEYEKIYFDTEAYTKYYCSRDVLITILFVEHIDSILVKEKISLFSSLTISALALKSFKLKFNYNKIPLKITKDLDSFIRPSYFGGRTEVFGNTKNKVYYYDFPGMYGIVMKEDFPYGKPYFVRPGSIIEPGFYSIKWESVNMKFPVLPLKNEYGKLVFVNGKGSGTYWFEEVLFFQEQGGSILEIDSALVYPHMSKVFDKFVDYFKSFREKGGGYKVLGKLITNSLYGKLGTSPDKSSYIILYEKDFEEYIHNNKVLSINKVNNLYVVERENKIKNPCVNVGYASMITAKARILLLKTILDIEKSGGRVLYCDTDSVFVETKDESIFKWEKTYDKGVFALPKTYGLVKNDIEEIRIKGIPRDSISYQEFEEKFYSQDYLRFKDVFNVKKSNFLLEIGKGEKIIGLNSYNKREFNEDFTDSKALKI